MPIESIYRWGGEVVEDQEWLLIAKTRSERFDAINDVVSEMHSYEVPPVLIVEMARASRPYRDWIDKS
jgi:periplasmic divalent cation tolerance protein